MMVGRWVSFWDCLFLGSMLNFRGVTPFITASGAHLVVFWGCLIFPFFLDGIEARRVADIDFGLVLPGMTRWRLFFPSTCFVQKRDFCFFQENRSSSSIPSFVWKHVFCVQVFFFFREGLNPWNLTSGTQKWCWKEDDFPFSFGLFFSSSSRSFSEGYWDVHGT